MRILKTWQSTIQLGDQHCVCRWSVIQWGSTPTGTVNITFISIKQEQQCLPKYMRILKTWQSIIQLCCLQKVWHPWGQGINRHNEDHTHTNKTGTTISSRVHADTETLTKHCPFGWSALCLQMAWQPWGQDINRHNEGHIHTNKTGTTMSSRVHVDTETLTKH